MTFENNTDKILYYSNQYNEIVSDEIAIIQASSLTINAYNNFIEKNNYFNLIYFINKIIDIKNKGLYIPVH